MTTTQLPKNLNYNILKPVGYPSKLVNYKFSPMTQIGANTNDIVRFNISTNGFWDPYSAYIEIDVDCNDMDAIGTLQVDNSAHSFINELLITQSGTEIERIQEYDVLASILNDMHYNKEQRSSHKHEGLGYIEAPNLRPDCFNKTPYIGSAVNLCGYKGQFTNKFQNSFFGFKPLLDKSNQYNSLMYANADFASSNYNLDNTNVANLILDPLPIRMMHESIQRYDFTHQQINASSYIDDTTVNFRHQKKLAFTGTDATSITALNDNGDLGIDNGYMNLNPNHYGYVQPFSSSFSATGFETTFSKQAIQSSVIKGFVDQNQNIVKGKFCIPILSGLLGILMPKESYKYIPMSVLNELVLEFRLNPYAMFTSGYTDDPKVLTYTHGGAAGLSTFTHTYTTPLTSYNQQQRKWRITKFDLHVEIHHFEPVIENQILSNIQTEEGIILHTNSWMFGPYYQFNAQQQPSGNYQINLGFESLKNVMFCFLPNDFLSYSYCRKQYRLSHNITSIQYKLGQQFFPSEKLTGHAGLPRGIGSFDLSNEQNNSTFVIELYKAFGKYNNINEDCLVNCDNFSVNQRVYNPASQAALLTLVSGTNVGTYVFSWQNQDTAAGQPLFHENRCIGKAVYAMNFETLNTDNSVISGINTIGIKPFDIILQSDSLQFQGNNNEGTLDPRFPRSSTMYTFCHYDMIIKITKTGTMVIGRG